MFHFVPTWGIKDEERMEKLLCVTPLPKIYLAWQTQKNCPFTFLCIPN